MRDLGSGFDATFIIYQSEEKCLNAHFRVTRLIYYLCNNVIWVQAFVFLSDLVNLAFKGLQYIKYY